MIGARLAAKTPLFAPLRRLIAQAMAHELHVLVVPGRDVALAVGLDLEAAGLDLAEGPRQANVLLVVGPMSPGIGDAASIAYAQMPRPRTVLVLGTDDVAPLPTPDATGALSQDGLEQAVRDLRQVIATGAFAPDTTDFDAPALQSRVEYTCPMHPEIVRDEPGSCPKCGMFLVPRETSAFAASPVLAGGQGGHDHGAKATTPAAANTHAQMTGPEPGAHVHDDSESALPDTASSGHYTCPMHAEVVSDTPGNCPKCGMTLVLSGAEDHAGHAHKHHESAPKDAARYTCPMHPEVVSDTPGNCPKCGMTLVLAGAEDHAGHTHKHHESAPQDAASYTCPMHAEVVSDTPGNCPKCGMTLVLSGAEDHAGHAHKHHEAAPQDAARYTCPMHPEVVSDTPGNCPKCGMTLVLSGVEDHAGHAHKHHEAAPHDAARYTCPMHPEVVSDTPGNCPKCGMTLITTPQPEHSAPDPSPHAGHAQSNDPGAAATGWLERIEPGFMSMIEMTDATPRSSDGLQMEWITTPFGPFFPGMPGGLTLDLTLDGDTVVEARPGSLVGVTDLLQDGSLPAAEYMAKLTAQMRLAPVSYRLLACRAIETATGAAPDRDTEQRRAAAQDRERIASHLFWLAQMGRQLGLARIARMAATLGLGIRDADQAAIKGQGGAINRLVAQVRGTRFLANRLATTGLLPDDADWVGPTGANATAAGRLEVRLEGITASLGRIGAAPGIALPELADIGDASGHGHATLETPRGMASLHVEIDKGRVVTAQLHTPSARHTALIGAITQQRELADALVAVASLDLSPWEMAP